MTHSLRLLSLTAACLIWAAAAGAQTPSTTPPPAPSSSSSDASDVSTRPATTTFFGDTGLWFAPTAEVLPSGKVSVSGYRRGTNYIQGYTNVADFAGTFAVGIKDRAEIFGSFLADTRIDRDVRPLFVNDPTYGGIIAQYPRVNQGWTGDNVGDLYLGVKLNLLSEYRQHPAALALRGIVKVPTGKKDVGVSTGKADVSVDFIASKDVAKITEVTGYAGYQYLGSPDGFDAPTSSFRWGAGAGFPSHSPVRVSAELNGVVPSDNTVTITGAPLVGTDGSIAPFVSNTEKLTRATFAVTFQAPKGFFVGAGVSWNVPQQQRVAGQSDSDPFADYWDWQVRIGYHPGVRVYVAPPPPPPPPPPAPAHDLSVKAACDPCTVEIGKSSTVTATVTDSISCAVTYRWSAPSGTFANAAERSTLWTSSQQEGSVPVTVTVTCPSDNKTASDTVNIQVLRPKPVVELNFEDVYFDFDRSTLRPEALRLLDDAVMRLQANPDKNIIIEGHTCNIGTAEYNLALGERRASSVRQYLMSRGVPASRLETRSYGEEQPKYDNTREETRRLNRRAALVVKVQ
ncbi:MAG TPA: OmpA family protein [Vicinamibacterales bacterium]|nr:OmpA family protein [Vicinamibacterales bacterium]